MLVCSDTVVVIFYGRGVQVQHAFGNLCVSLAVLTTVKMLDKGGIVMILLVFVLGWIGSVGSIFISVRVFGRVVAMQMNLWSLSKYFPERPKK